MTGRHAVAADGTRIYYEVAGGDADGPAVLLVMGLGFGAAVWGETRERLVDAGYRTVTMDNRGMGRSDVPSVGFTTAVMADDALAVLRAAGVQRPHVVGTSLGGMIAQRLAIDRPSRVGGLVLQSTTGGLPRVDFVPIGVVRRTAALIRTRKADVGSEERARAALALLTTVTYAKAADLTDPRLQVYLEALRADISMDGWRAQIRAASRHRAWRQLRTIRAPTLVQHGARDGVVRAAAGRAIARRIPGARLEAYRGAGHLMALQRPDSIDALVRFLQGLDRADAGG